MSYYDIFPKIDLQSIKIHLKVNLENKINLLKHI